MREETCPDRPKVSPERLEEIRARLSPVAWIGEASESAKELIAWLQDTCGDLIAHIDRMTVREQELEQLAGEAYLALLASEGGDPALLSKLDNVACSLALDDEVTP